MKLGNLFLSPDLTLKLGDFGLAAKLRDPRERRKTLCGTPNYISPEVIMNQTYSYEVDVWAIGVILYTMLVGRPPFETKEVKTTYWRIKKNDYNYPNPDALSFEARHLITWIL